MPVLWTLWNFQETKMTSWLKNIYLIRNHHYNNNIFLKKYIEICKTNKKKNPRNIFQYAFFVYVLFLLFSQSVVSDSLQSHGQLHARLPCPSLSPGVCSNSCPLSRRWHPTISSSVTPILLLSQSFPASRSFPFSQLFTSGGQFVLIVL